MEGFINRLLKLMSEFVDVSNLDAVFRVAYDDEDKEYTAQILTKNTGNTYGGTGYEIEVVVPENKFFEPTFQTWFIYNLTDNM